MGTVVNGNKWTGACVDGNIVSGLVKNGIVFYRKINITTKLDYSVLRIMNISVKTSDGNWSQYAKTDDIVRIILYLNETSYSSLKLSVNNVIAGNMTYDSNMQAYRYDYKIKSTDTQFNFTITGYNDSGVNVGYLTELDANHSTQNYIVIDNDKPTIITLAILNNTPADNETGYKYATNGDTIRVLATFNEELILNDNFVLTINNTTVKFSRSGDKVNSDGTPKYEYIAQYKIPEDESELAEGPITFEISGYSDLAGNTNSPITTANHPKYNSVEYYI